MMTVVQELRWGLIKGKMWRRRGEKTFGGSAKHIPNRINLPPISSAWGIVATFVPMSTEIIAIQGKPSEVATANPSESEDWSDIGCGRKERASMFAPFLLKDTGSLGVESDLEETAIEVKAPPIDRRDLKRGYGCNEDAAVWYQPVACSVIDTHGGERATTVVCIVSWLMG
ncbi:hypothetical protein E1B28_002268 [Marasmius oreades]|uniref:Uncharacterized protein n=1 Tax=Marasmius oreades TaxID=181124 RepID=A0A9P7RMI1_9AGAR|nr:uncharacterized protein E1B28_002268 [Marasmius oreades]KAG7086304.1 hypothetical protein E1B28_002268 [Marasmius oreades]